MSEVIPEGWSLEPLASCIAESIAGEWGSDANGDSNDIPVLRSTNFTNSGKIDYTKIVYRNIDARKRVKKKLNKGDIVLEKSGGSPTQPVGRVVYFDRDTPFLYSNFTQKLVVQQGHDQKYVFYKFLAEYEDGTILKFQQQTTGIINFQLSEYLLYQTLLAPLPEQQKIATILSSVDDVIEKTRAQIDKLKDLKTGMMQELLTQGIGHTEFKDSQVGKIPASWNVCPLDHLAVLSRGRFSHRPRNDPTFYGGQHPFLQTGDIPKDSIWIRSYSQSLNNKGYGVSKLFPKGTLVITIAATIGEVGILDFDACFPDSLVGISVKNEIANVSYLAYTLRYFSAELNALAPQSAQKNINLEILNPFEIPTPPLSEQKLIAEAIESIDARIEAISNTLRQAINIKKALMQDLLTGKVRVKIDTTETAAA